MEKIMQRKSPISFFALLLSFLLSSTTATSFNTTTANRYHQQPRNLSIESAKYVVKACLADGIGKPCTGNTSSERVDLRITQQQAPDSCEAREHMKGSVSYADLMLPTKTSPGKVLLVEVVTRVPGQDSNQGFFVRPTRKTRYWGRATVQKRKATFYLADTGQVRTVPESSDTTNINSNSRNVSLSCHTASNRLKQNHPTLTLSSFFSDFFSSSQFSVEFASDAMWKNKNDVTTFDALMLFVNPEITIPTKNVITVSPNSKEVAEDLGPNKRYVFKKGISYDWGADHVFKVHDNTKVYFEEGAHVRARIVQTEKKVKNVVLKGYGTLDVHYDLDWIKGISDDATRQVRQESTVDSFRVFRRIALKPYSHPVL
jgi:hypothetical protein